MKRIDIPLVDKSLWIWIGPEEWKKFQKAAAKNKCLSGTDNPLPEGESGRAWGSDIWVNDKKDINTVFHETQHFLHDLFEYLGCTKETEFKAYLAAEVHEQILRWLNDA